METSWRPERKNRMIASLNDDHLSFIVLPLYANTKQLKALEEMLQIIDTWVKIWTLHFKQSAELDKSRARAVYCWLSCILKERISDPKNYDMHLAQGLKSTYDDGDITRQLQVPMLMIYRQSQWEKDSFYATAASNMALSFLLILRTRDVPQEY
jgi:hypothetical protein